MSMSDLQQLSDLVPGLDLDALSLSHLSSGVGSTSQAAGPNQVRGLKSGSGLGLGYPGVGCTSRLLIFRFCAPTEQAEFWQNSVRSVLRRRGSRRNSGGFYKT